MGIRAWDESRKKGFARVMPDDLMPIEMNFDTFVNHANSCFSRTSKKVSCVKFALNGNSTKIKVAIYLYSCSKSKHTENETERNERVKQRTWSCRF